jgi:hypothetical protein
MFTLTKLNLTEFFRENFRPSTGRLTVSTMLQQSSHLSMASGRGPEATVQAGARDHCTGRGLEATVQAGARDHCTGRGLEATVQAGG